MSRSARMFEIIQLLRGAAKPLTAGAIAERLEVTKRTVYRDIAALQAMRVPIDGQAGIGYLMRPGYDLPPLNFSVEEVEAIVVGLALLDRTGDAGLQAAAASASGKIGAVLPEDGTADIRDNALYVSGWHALPEAKIDMVLLRRAVRDHEKLRLTYVDGEGVRTERTVLPLALLFYIEAIVLAAWCELRSDFRHFRVDRMMESAPTDAHFRAEAKALRRKWRAQHDLP